MGTLAHPKHSQPLPARSPGGGREADPIVAQGQAQAPPAPVQTKRDPAGAGVALHVGESLLGNPQQPLFQSWSEAPHRRVDSNLDLDSGAGLEVVAELHQSWSQTVLVEGLGAEALYELAQAV